MISLWHHALLHHSGNGGDLDLGSSGGCAAERGSEQVESTQAGAHRQRLGSASTTFGCGSRAGVSANLRKLFNVEDDRFPAKRLEERARK